MPLRTEDFIVDGDIATARTLPPHAFTEPEFLERELATIFSRNWLFVPQRTAGELRADPRSLTDLLRLRGSHLPVTMLDRPLFLQRDWDERLHAFPNVCSHAWYPLVHGLGRERTIVCGQHGRRFDSAGRYLGQPGFEGAGPQPEDDLQELSLAEWEPFLFVAFGSPLQPFETLMAEVQDSLACFPLGDLQRAPHDGEVREVEGNWKQHAWNYMDVFHLSHIHRAPGGLAGALDMDSYRTELYAASALQWAYAARPEHGFEPQLLPRRFAHPTKRVFALWWFIFPNLTLNFYPWGLSVNVYMPVPRQPERTLFLWYHYVLDQARYEQREQIWLNRQVDAEDVDAMRQVSRGVRSGLARRGRFSPGEEAGSHWFQRLVYTTTFMSS